MALPRQPGSGGRLATPALLNLGTRSIVRDLDARFVGFDEKILALYSRGLSTRDIEAHLQEIYGVKVGRELISRVTDAVMDDVREWGKRPLEDIYPIVFLDCMVLKIREGGTVQRRALYLALGVTLEGDRDVLGMWFQETEGAKFWMQVLTDLKTRGVRDILIACVDGLKGFPEAIEAIFPKTTVQKCIVSDPLEPLRARTRPESPPASPLKTSQRRLSEARLMSVLAISSRVARPVAPWTGQWCQAHGPRVWTRSLGPRSGACIFAPIRAKPSVAERGSSCGDRAAQVKAEVSDAAPGDQCVWASEPGVRRTRTPSGSRTIAIVTSPFGVACVTRRGGPATPSSASLLRVASTSTKYESMKNPVVGPDGDNPVGTSAPTK